MLSSVDDWMIIYFSNYTNEKIIVYKNICKSTLKVDIDGIVDKKGKLEKENGGS